MPANFTAYPLYFFASMDMKWVSNCVHNGLEKVLKSLEFNLLKPAETLEGNMRYFFNR